jgi:hypothetical protein
MNLNKSFRKKLKTILKKQLKVYLLNFQTEIILCGDAVTHTELIFIYGEKLHEQLGR